MAVSGKELATLDFANLIGGPLNAVVEAQAKSAISTASFVKEVGFDKNNNVITTDFNITKTNTDGRKQDFKLSVPFLSMLPIPYIKVDQAVIEFNAKITSTTESTSESTFKNETNLSAGGSWWFGSAKISSKTSYQKKSAHSDKEERTFDMHVKVTASNTDMPSGTERILNLLEEGMFESPGTIHPELLTLRNPEGENSKDNEFTYPIKEGNFSKLKKGDKVYENKKDSSDEEKPLGEVVSINIDKEEITLTVNLNDNRTIYVY